MGLIGTGTKNVAGASNNNGKFLSLWDALREFCQSKPTWGTCAGMIFMAKDIGMDQPLLGIMDIVVERNAFGRQVDSFETMLAIEGLYALVPAVFIRAPKLVAAHGAARVIAKLEDGTAVAAQEGHWLVTSFHPELTNDLSLHRYFVGLVEQASLLVPAVSG